ncbi:MAG: 4Fe-4S binding protein [Clostridiaceae bacterium]|nr:4Fe-4S binding protein [Clostridiaceae bacterium]
MDEFKCAIKAKAEALQIDLIGFAAKDRFTGLDPQYDPFSIFPDGHTVILVGQMIPRGALRGIEEGTDTTAYSNFGYSWLDNQFVAQSTYDLVRFIEDAGWEACPIFPNPLSTTAMGVPVAEGRPAPNVTPDFDYAAVACGLGELGLNQEILTVSLGHRQRFQMIITDAELESDPLVAPALCDHCGACAEACPLKAVHADKIIERTICGRSFTMADIDFELCKKCPNGGMANRLHPSGKPDRYAAACNRACLAELDKRGIGSMQQPYRTHESWKKNRRGDLI